MRPVFLILALTLLASPILAQEPQIDPASPFENISYKADSGHNEIDLTVTLRQATATAKASVPLHQFKITALKVTSEGRSGSPSQDQASGNSLNYGFRIPVDTTEATPAADGVFRLNSHWNSFSFHLEYTVDDPNSTFGGAHQTVEVQVLRNLVNSTVEYQPLQPILASDGKTVTVPVRVTNADFAAAIELRASAEDRHLVASGTGLVGRDSSTNVKLAVVEGNTILPERAYILVLRALYRTDLIVSRPETPVVVAAERQREPYKIVQVSSSLDKLVVEDPSKDYNVDVTTNCQGADTLKAIVPGSLPITVQGDQNIHHVQIGKGALANLPDGPLVLSFTGQCNDQTLAPIEKPFAFQKDTSVKIVGVSTLSLDSKQVLHLQYSLSREIQNFIQITNSVSVEGVKMDTNQKFPRYEVKIALTEAPKVNALQLAAASSSSPSSPKVTLSLLVSGINSNLVSVGGFELNLAPILVPPADPATLTTAITNAAQQVHDRHPDDAQRTLKSAFGIPDGQNPTPDQQNLITGIINSLQQHNANSAKEIAITFLSTLGQVALRSFGIPVPAAPVQQPSTSGGGH
jgi:hypothetical protein